MLFQIVLGGSILHNDKQSNRFAGQFLLKMATSSCMFVMLKASSSYYSIYNEVWNVRIEAHKLNK